MPNYRAYAAARFAIRPTVIAKLLSQLFGVLSVVMVAPTLVSAVGAPLLTTTTYLGIIALLLTAYLLGRILPNSDNVQTNEAMVTVALLFVLTSLLLSLPIMTLGIAFEDAWFEAVSGITTTGLSVINLEDKPWAFLFNRGWMQWVGGVGVVVLALGISIFPSSVGSRLGFSEQEMGDAVGGTRAHAKRVLIVYCALTAVGIVLLSLDGSPLLDAVVHSMAAVSTGGFANHADSLSSASSYHIAVVSLLCIAGAVSFHIYYLATFLPEREKWLDNQFFSLLLTIGLISLLAVAISWYQQSDLSWWQVVTLVVSAQTTAGFSTAGEVPLPNWLLLMLCGSMLVGGGLGSTSGGIKLGRALFVFQQARMHLIQSSASDRLYMSWRANASEAFLRDAMAVIGWFIAVLFASWLIFVMHGYPPLQSLYEVTSALSTAGLSAGLSHADLPALLKFVLCVDMLLGRVEIVAFLILFMPYTWKGHRRRIKTRTS